jgi:hypothetical protein
MVFGLVSETADGLTDLAEGDLVEFDMWVTTDPDADPWQSFRGVVTQIDGELDTDGRFDCTVYAADDVVRLSGMLIGYTVDWPEENIEDRLDRICTEAGLTLDNFTAGSGQQGVLAARAATVGAISVYDALAETLKDCAIENTSEPPDVFYGRDVFGYSHADTTVTVQTFQRRTFTQGTLDGALVELAGRWSKLPGPVHREWVIVDGNEYGTPSGPPIVRRTNLVDVSPTNFSEVTRDNLGASLLPDGSTMLDGWYSRVLRYHAHLAPDPVGPALAMAHGWASWAPMLLCLPVFVTGLKDAYELNGEDYIGGTLTGARLMIPAGGEFVVDIRLRPELLPDVTTP